MAVGIGIKFGWPWAILGGAGIAGFFCWVVLNPYSQILGPVRRMNDDEQILITIDDGPDPRDTPVLLDLLDRHQTKAVFFMIGEKVRAHPELTREVVRRGHEIGNHTLTHPQASFWCAGPWRTRREISTCQKLIEEVTGIRPRWFRAPAGHRNWFTHPVASALGLQVMAWNRRGFDAVEKDAGKVLARILPHLSNGDIVLLHEATPIADGVLGGVLENVSRLSQPDSSIPTSD
jgi:peptidoglycan/xylan/chitin deacetylase (PgdA/CDA1 family)